MIRLKYYMLTLLVIYILFAFILGDVNLMNGTNVMSRIPMVVITVFVMTFVIRMLEDRKYNDPPHEEKVAKAKRYVGELKEELALYNEAMELQKKINAIRK